MRTRSLDQPTAMNQRRFDIAIYGDNGNLLRDRREYVITDLAYDSALPGGYKTASFTLHRHGKTWPGKIGNRVIIRRGRTVLWWGTIEDISRRQQAHAEQIEVTCIGPWQQLHQRRFSCNYSGVVYGDAALAQELRMYCDLISRDTSQLMPTGVNIANLTWSYARINDLVKLVCKTGDSLGREMLFAIRAPTYRATNGYPLSILPNSDAETEGSGSGAGWPTNWRWSSTTSSIGIWSTQYYHSPGHSLMATRGSASGTQYGTWYQTNVTCTSNTVYTVDYWLYFGAFTSLAFYVQITWYDANNNWISTNALTTRYSSGTAGGNRYLESITSPSSAKKFDIELKFTLPDSGSVFAAADDIYVYAQGAMPAIDVLPRAHLWPKDLSKPPDYYVWTTVLPFETTMTSRELANAVIASYGSDSQSYTAWVQDMKSQSAYRRRDHVISAGNVSAQVAAMMRDAYLAAYKEPRFEPGFLRIEMRALSTRHGRKAYPEMLQAGDLVEIADGPNAGRRLLLNAVRYENGVVTATPEREADLPLLLARTG